MFARTSLILAAAAGLASLGMSAAPAQAGIRDIDVAIRIGRPAPTRVWVEPVYETRCERVWVEPVYQTRCERVWREPVYEERAVQTWVPDRYECRQERYRDRWGRVVYREVRVLVEPGHYEQSCQRVLVREGCWENVEQRVCVTAGYWTNVEKRVCVREGFWQEACPPSGRPEVRVEVSKRYESDDRPHWRPERSDRHDPRGDDRRRGDDDDRPSRSRYDRGDRYASR